ncbi:MAG: HEAT repeat domain-containing protein [Methanobrevibacter sp.]|nr:HEAT repeat domain-containing protein [Methanobrevibacter sp.]
MFMISEKELLEELRQIQKSNENWKNHIDDVAAKLDENYSVNVKAKALWILGEMGLKYPQQVKPYINQIAGYMDDDNPKLRERSINALGRIGRADKNLVTPYLDKLMNMRNDDMGNVRLAFVWACENIATNSPELFCEKMDIFCDLIDDSNEKVRIEAPEMFRVVGKRKPMYVKPYLNKLQSVAENNEHPVVRIHCEGAIRITNNALDKNNDL